MKQHITIEQFEELSKEARTKLLVWWKKQDFTTGTLIVDDEIYPMLTIGQMIDFLDEKGFELQFENMVDLDDDSGKISRGKGWSLVKQRLPYYVEVDWNDEYSEENHLCNLLWHAVKDVLETKQ